MGLKAVNSYGIVVSTIKAKLFDDFHFVSSRFYLFSQLDEQLDYNKQNHLLNIYLNSECATFSYSKIRHAWNGVGNGGKGSLAAIRTLSAIQMHFERFYCDANDAKPY